MIVSRSDNIDTKKVNLGQFNTKKSVWLMPQVENFIRGSGCKYGLDPFAGAGDLINIMPKLGLKNNIGLDIDSSLGWKINDSLIDIPYYKDTIVITNPPYLAKNSAKEKGLDAYEYFNYNGFVDLYQLAINTVINTYDFSVFIIPETFVSTMDFNTRINSITILEENPFEDTDVPVCVACFHDLIDIFNPQYDIYKNNSYIFDNEDLQYEVDKLNGRRVFDIEFNNPNGNVGLRAIDGIDPKDRIRFCSPDELGYDLDNIKVSSRAISVLNVDLTYSNIGVGELITAANKNLEQLRENTHDVILSPFKNNNREGRRRRRLDYKLARKILNFSGKALTNGKR